MKRLTMPMQNNNISLKPGPLRQLFVMSVDSSNSVLISAYAVLLILYSTFSRYHFYGSWGIFLVPIQRSQVAAQQKMSGVKLLIGPLLNNTASWCFISDRHYWCWQLLESFLKVSRSRNSGESLWLLVRRLGLDVSDVIAERTNDEGLRDWIYSATRDSALKEDSASFVGRGRSITLWLSALSVFVTYVTVTNLHQILQY